MGAHGNRMVSGRKMLILTDLKIALNGRKPSFFALCLLRGRKLRVPSDSHKIGRVMRSGGKRPWY